MIFRVFKFVILLVYALWVTACSASSGSPVDQLINGPFNITDEWQTIHLDKPLETIPNVQFLDVLIDMDGYEYKHVEGTSNDPYRLMLDSFHKVSDSKLMDIEIILVTASGKEFHTTYKSNGSTELHGKHYNHLGFGTNPNLGKFIYPKGIKIVALKIRSNMPIVAEYLWWYAYKYEMLRKQTWADVDPTEIVSFDYISDQ
ncbi:hypothetical protein [Gynuella sunshinyii]|uniref:Uncharacterized protein n=1 Tax=Gynuella sunshinyii YC6258 TaxID=1445510 RepID=A0A0C5W046_9GAMM|nr:hypothetical protein [Gynuella sunshinyii]AJQ96049.1 hypothetical Protein YC6258_04013 [Gynuella sunshinyii YC6258]